MNADELGERSQPNAEDRATFIGVIRGFDTLPESVREEADSALISESLFDHTYIEFLDLQIQLGVRGPEWSDRLRKRHAALESFCGVRLLHGYIWLSADLYSFYVHPGFRRVIHWELHENERNAS